MKNKNYLLFGLLFFFIHAHGQEYVEKGSYQFISNELPEFSPQNIKGEKEGIEIKKGSKITVLNYSPDDSIVYYRYWGYRNKNSDAAKTYSTNIYTMGYESFVRLTEQLYSRYKGANVGVYTVPFRLRGIGDDFDFESSLSLQSNLVFGFGSRTSSRSNFDLSMGIGLTSINLNEKNSLVTSERTASAFTISIGALWKPAEYANIGLFVGWDNLGAKDKEVNWKYDGKTWLGLGINISFNQIETDKTPSVSMQ